MENNKHLISIIIPTYNRANYLKECIDSIVNQEGFNEDEIEIIISDNASTDNTIKVIESFKYCNIFYYKNDENIGSYKNVIKAFSYKKGQYFMFISDDDKFYNKNSLKVLYKNLKKYNLDACYGITECFNKKEKFILKGHLNKIKNNDYIYIDKFKEQLKFNTMSFGGMLYKDTGIKYDVNAKEYLDWDFNLQYLEKGYKIGLINEKTFLYRIHDNQDSNTINNKSFGLTMYIYIKYNMIKYYPVTFILWKIAGIIFNIFQGSKYFNNIYGFLSKIRRNKFIKNKK